MENELMNIYGDSPHLRQQFMLNAACEDSAANVRPDLWVLTWCARFGDGHPAKRFL